MVSDCHPKIFACRRAEHVASVYRAFTVLGRPPFFFFFVSRASRRHARRRRHVLRRWLASFFELSPNGASSASYICSARGNGGSFSNLYFFIILLFFCWWGCFGVVGGMKKRSRARALFKVRLLQLMRWKLHELFCCCCWRDHGQTPFLLFLPPRKSYSEAGARPSNKQLQPNISSSERRRLYN